MKLKRQLDAELDIQDRARLIWDFVDSLVIYKKNKHKMN